jgi:hypothetical protein
MADVLGRVDPLDLGVLDDEVVVEVAVQGDVDVLRDGRGDEEPAPLATVERREIGAAPAQRDAQR